MESSVTDMGATVRVGDRFRDFRTRARALAPGLTLKAVAAVAAITAAGAALRFATLSQSVWFDESVTVREVGGSFAHLLSSVINHEASPPLYFICVWVWRHIFGSSVLEMRAFSALAGTLTIPVAFAAARRLAGIRAGVAVAALVGTSPALLYYSQELRMYGLLMLLSALAFLAFLEVRERPNRRNISQWAGLSALALMTHYSASLAVLPQAFLVLRYARRSELARREATVAVGAVTLVFAAVCILLKYQWAHAWQYGTSLLTSPFTYQPLTAHNSAVGGNSVHEILQGALVGPGGQSRQLALLALLGFVVIGLLLFRRLPRDRRRVGGEFALGLTIPGALVVTACLILQVPMQGRYLLPLWLPAVIAIASGMSALESRRIGVAALVLVSVTGIALGVVFATVPQLTARDDSRGAATALGTARVNRLIALNQKWDLLPMQLYRSASGLYARRLAYVSELDIVEMPVRDYPSAGDAIRPSPWQPRELPPGLTLTRIILGRSWVIERYSSARPVALPINPAGGIFPARWRFLYERAGAKVNPL